MANNVAATAGTGTTFKTTDNAGVHTGHVNVDTLPALAAGTANIGDVDVLTVPTDPFGANADAASSTGSISAKLRAMATAWGTSALDLGSGTGGSRTLRWFHDTAQWIGGAGAVTSAVQRTTLASDDPAVAVLGAQADAASVSTTISAKLRAIATAIGTGVIARGAGAYDSLTIRFVSASDDPGFASVVSAINTASDPAINVTPTADSADGLSIFRSLDLDETEEAVKATAGNLYKLRITNFATSVRYVKLYNDTVANVIVGTTASPTLMDTIPVPAGSATVPTVITENYGGLGAAFSVALTLACTTGLADNDTGAPGASEVVVSAYYK